MSQKTAGSRRERPFVGGLVAAISAGGFFVLLGLVFVINSNLWSNILEFAKDFTNVTIPNTTMQVPMPLTPAAHVAVYSAVYQFVLGIGILQIIILAVRLAFSSPARRISQSVGALVFWFGAAYLLNIIANMSSALSVSEQQTMWFQFWAAILIVLGVSLVIRGAVVLTASKLRSH
jgi:uncharacterized membrane protein